MFASQLITQEIFPLKKSDSAEAAALFFQDWKVSWLPVVESGTVLGVVKEDQVLNHTDERVELLMQADIAFFCVGQHQHLFEVMRKMETFQLDCIAVLDNEQHYLGMIAAAELPLFMERNSSLSQHGSVLVLEMPAIQYSLAELSRISESNQIRILHLVVQPLKENSDLVLVSMKLSSTEIRFLISSYERFGYQVVYTDAQTDDDQTMTDRYNWLLKYLQT